MLRKNLIAIIVLIIISQSTYAIAAQTQLEVTVGKGHEDWIDLKPEGKYRVITHIKGEQPNAIVTLAVSILDHTNTQIAQTQVQRGLGNPDLWYLITAEIDVPANAEKTKVSITVNHAGQYMWQGLRVEDIDHSSDALKAEWDAKLAKHGQIYTGLVIDARGLNVKRGMSPRIWSESGQLIYGGLSASYEYMHGIGLVSYAHEMNAQTLQRITVDPDYPLAVPLVIGATSALQPGQTNVTISNNDALRVLAALEKYDFLARYSVVFLID